MGEEEGKWEKRLGRNEAVISCATSRDMDQHADALHESDYNDCLRFVDCCNATPRA